VAETNSQDRPALRSMGVRSITFERQLWGESSDGSGSRAAGWEDVE
jgi:hypothetical protein